MRRDPSTDTLSAPMPAGGASLTTRSAFDAAYAELAAARAAYDLVAGDPHAVPSLAAASERLTRARQRMDEVRAAA